LIMPNSEERNGVGIHAFAIGLPLKNFQRINPAITSAATSSSLASACT
jgi:hypothetical protein